MRRLASFLGLSSFFGGKMILLAPSKEHEEDKSGGGRDRQPRPPSWPLSSFLRSLSHSEAAFTSESFLLGGLDRPRKSM